MILNAASIIQRALTQMPLQIANHEYTLMRIADSVMPVSTFNRQTWIPKNDGAEVNEEIARTFFISSLVPNRGPFCANDALMVEDIPDPEPEVA